MKSVKVRSDYEKAIIICLFWTIKKTKTFDGCAPFSIEKILMNDKIYAPEGKKRFKLTPEIIIEIKRI